MHTEQNGLGYMGQAVSHRAVSPTLFIFYLEKGLYLVAQGALDLTL